MQSWIILQIVDASLWVQLAVQSLIDKCKCQYALEVRNFRHQLVIIREAFVYDSDNAALHLLNFVTFDSFTELRLTGW
jgi:hypothetical protein